MDRAVQANAGYFTTDSHDRLRDAVRRFADNEVRPRLNESEDGRSMRELSFLIARQGWLGVTIDSRYGGLGLGNLAKTIAIEELSRVSGAMGAMLQASQLGVAKILHYGSGDQQEKWLPAIASGRCLPTIAVTELESGSHVLGISATADRDGNEYILNGRKVYVGNSEIGTLHGVIVRTGTGSGGLSAFLVESDRAGLTVGPSRPSLGLHGFSFGELSFENCRIPEENLLGAVGDGLAIAYSSSVLYGRPNLAAVALGIHRAIVEDSLAFAAQQQRYGRPLAELPTVKQKLGQMQSRLMTARLVAYHGAHLLDRGLACDAELMNSKLVNVEYALDSARDAMDVHGARALHTDRPIERYLRDVYHLVTPAGTSDVQRLRLADLALGPTRDQWSERLSARVGTGTPS